MFAIVIMAALVVAGSRPMGTRSDIEVHNVLRSFHNVSSPWSSAKYKFKLSGHVAVMRHPASGPASVASLAVLPPLHGCGTGRGNTVPELAAAFVSRRHFVVNLAAPTAVPLFITSSSFGCRVASNGNLFATGSLRCHGNIVSNGLVIHSDSKTVAHFGLFANSTVHFGYLSAEQSAQLRTAADEQGRAMTRLLEFIDGSLNLDATELRRAVADAWPEKPRSDFDQLIAGLVWLVRDGKSYVATGAPQSHEDMSAQETGSSSVFIDVASARTAIGVDGEGRIVIAQVDGKSDWAGLDLRSFADWLITDLQLQQAINLDGGASATWVRDGAVTANLPSYSCLADGAVKPHRRVQSEGLVEGRGVSHEKQARAAVKEDPNFKCLRPVSAGLCMHDVPPEPRVVSVERNEESTAGNKANRVEQLAVDVEDGCVCFHEAAVGDPDRGVSDSFTWKEATALFRMRGSPLSEGTSRRLQNKALRWSQMLAQQGLSDPLLSDPLLSERDGVVGPQNGPRRAEASDRRIHLWPPEPYLTVHARAAAAAWLRSLGLPLDMIVLHSDPICVCSGLATTGAAQASQARTLHFTLHRKSFQERLDAWYEGLAELAKAAPIRSFEHNILAAWPAYVGEQDHFVGRIGPVHNRSSTPRVRGAVTAPGLIPFSASAHGLDQYAAFFVAILGICAAIAAFSRRRAAALEPRA